MGFFSKLWKGVKKTFKKIFKPIKNLFKKVGKFMGKLGIAGQIALMFIPFGQMLGPMMKGFAKFGGKMLTSLKGMGAIGNAAATVIGKGVEFASMAKAGFDTVTGAVTGFFKTTGKWIGGKLGMAEFKGLTWDQAWGEYSQNLTNSWEKLGSKATEFWDTDIKGATETYRMSTLEANMPSALDVSRTGINPADPAFSENLQMSPVLNPNVEAGSPAYLQGMTADRANLLGIPTTAPQMSNVAFAGETAAGVINSTAVPGGPSAPATTPIPETRSLLDKTVDYAKELPGAMAKNVAMTGLTQAAMGRIQGEPDVDLSPMWGARRGPGIEDFTAPLYAYGLQPVNYQQMVIDDTSYSTVPVQYQQYGGGSSFWEQMMAQYNRPTSAMA